MPNQESVKLTIRGKMLYPKKEGDKVSYALAVEPKLVDKVNKKVSETFDKYELNWKDNEDKNGVVIDDSQLLNVKSSFDVPLFNEKGERLEDTRIFHDAEVYATISVKEYTYKKKHGITAYLMGIVLIKNGEDTSLSFDSMMKETIE